MCFGGVCSVEWVNPADAVAVVDLVGVDLAAASEEGVSAALVEEDLAEVVLVEVGKARFLQYEL